MLRRAGPGLRAKRVKISNFLHFLALRRRAQSPPRLGKEFHPHRFSQSLGCRRVPREPQKCTETRATKSKRIGRVLCSQSAARICSISSSLRRCSSDSGASEKLCWSTSPHHMAILPIAGCCSLPACRSGRASLTSSSLPATKSNVSNDLKQNLLLVAF